MRHSSKTTTRRGSMLYLTAGLALALCLAGGAGASAPAATTAVHGASDTMLRDILQSGLLPADMAARLAAKLSTRAHAPAATSATATTLTVTSCADSGFGSLRAAVANAASGDIIDMSGLDCTISLLSNLAIVQDSLTLQGDTAYTVCGLNPVEFCASPTVAIDGQNNGSAYPQILKHTGAGTLTINEVLVQNSVLANNWTGGYVGGSCISSYGSVTLNDAAVRHCTINNTAQSGTGSTLGAGISSQSTVRLTNSVVDDAHAMNTGKGTGPVFGGGIYAGDDIFLTASSVTNSSAKAAYGDAAGGGIWADRSVVIKESSHVDDNSATSVYEVAKGGGVYAGPTGVFFFLQGNSTVSGNQVDGDSNGDGGGIFSETPVEVYSSDISRNEASDDGAGIYANAGLSVSDSLISYNDADSVGGGLYLPEGDVFIKDSNIRKNSADYAGALYSSQNVEIDTSSIIGNTSAHHAVVNIGYHATETLQIDQSTISGNNSVDSGFGAGLYLQADAEISNSTITGNTGKNSNNLAHGAGISIKDGVSLVLSSTIVSGNHIDIGGNLAESDIGLGGGANSAVVAGNHNLIGWIDPAISPPVGTIFTDDPGLGPLLYNGGPTRTHMPAATSAAIDQGIANGFSRDQRGSFYLRTANGQTDIGSVERDGSDRIFADGFEPDIIIL